MITAGVDARPAGTRAFDDVPRRLIHWARRRSLAANSVTVISLTLSVCAAGWYSAGTTVDYLGGGLALCACYLAWCGARRLAAADGPASTVSASTGSASTDAASTVSASTDAASAVSASTGSASTGSPATRLAGLSAASLATLGGLVSSAVACAGLAVGGRASGQAATWELATAAVIMMAVRDLAGACRGEAAADAGVVSPRGHPAGRAIRTVLEFPFGGRVALIAVAAPIWGARVTLLALLGWAIVGLGSAIASPVRRRVVSPARPDSVGAATPDDAPADLVVPITVAMPADVVAASPVVAPAVAVSAVTGPAVAGPAVAGSAGPIAGMDAESVPAVTGPAATLDDILAAEPAEEPEPVTEPHSRVLATTMACRDDGRFAVRIGQMVRGQLVPLPPAFAGLAATALLAWLGMRNLPGLLLFTPLVVMLLAAFGSAHPHDRGLDWLTPAVLLGGQLLYIGAVGFSFRVPAALTFTLCVLTALHCASLASGASPGSKKAALGWEGRMFVVGFGAILGAPAVVFAGLALYLAVTTGARVLPRYIALPRD